VALGDRGVLSSKERRDRVANNITSSQHDNIGTSKVDASRREKVNDARGSARREEGLGRARGQVSNVVRVESIPDN
jgi:hypothetical protein